MRSMGASNSRLYRVYTSISFDDGDDPTLRVETVNVLGPYLSLSAAKGSLSRATDAFQWYKKHRQNTLVSSHIETTSVSWEPIDDS